MFAATPRWKDRLDARKLLLVALVALVAFALQLGLLAGTVASPLGGMIADLDRVPQLDARPDRSAYARSDAPSEPGMPWQAPQAAAPWVPTLPEYCVLYR